MANPDGGTGFPGQIQGRDSTSKAPLDLFADETAGALHIAVWYYNPVTLAWERGRQPQIESEVGEEQRTLLDYDGSDNLIYMGVNPAQDAAVTATDWTVTKFIYTGSNITGMQTLVGRWDQRTTLAWI